MLMVTSTELKEKTKLKKLLFSQKGTNMQKSKNHNLFTVGNTKTVKGLKQGYLTLILHFAPHTMNDKKINVCPHATESCIATCLNDSGRYRLFPAIKKARIRKTNQFLENRALFIDNIAEEIQYYKNQASKKGLLLCVRLNGTSDIRWSKVNSTQGKNLFTLFPTIQFYDYTKNPYIVGDSKHIKNYHITFSFSGENHTECWDVAGMGINIAVAFQGVKKSEEFTGTWQGKKIVDGDLNDLRFLDKRGMVVGLRVKGIKQKTMENSFLVQIERKKAS